jgi:hypothetical protein
MVTNPPIYKSPIILNSVNRRALSRYRIAGQLPVELLDKRVPYGPLHQASVSL